MRTHRLFLTIFITLSLLPLTFLQGCASLFNRGSDESSDSAYSSQAAEAPANPDTLDLNSEEYHRTHVARAIEQQDIVPGMSPQEVVSAWGRPREIQVAGEGRSGGNERWLYYSGNSLRYGINQARVIYFENGRVAGWESGR
jgi:hypothetical protein